MREPFLAQGAVNLIIGNHLPLGTRVMACPACPAKSAALAWHQVFERSAASFVIGVNHTLPCLAWHVEPCSSSLA